MPDNVIDTPALNNKLVHSSHDWRWHHSKPWLSSIRLRMMSWITPKMFFTRSVSVAVVAKSYTSRFGSLFLFRYCLFMYSLKWKQFGKTVFLENLTMLAQSHSVPHSRAGSRRVCGSSASPGTGRPCWRRRWRGFSWRRWSWGSRRRASDSPSFCSWCRPHTASGWSRSGRWWRGLEKSDLK